MPHRLTLDTLDSLHLTLQRLEQASGSVEDQQAMADLKGIILHRIAELEVLHALGHEETATETATTLPSDLLPPPAVTEAEKSAASLDRTELDKLN